MTGSIFFRDYRFNSSKKFIVFNRQETFKAHITQYIFAHNIAIKRYCNKKIKRHFLSKYCSDILKYFQTRFQ